MRQERYRAVGSDGDENGTVVGGQEGADERCRVRTPHRHTAMALCRRAV
jgi:hypothetical protein